MNSTAIATVADASVASANTETKLKEVLTRTALLLPADVGANLMHLAEPSALATMAVVTGTWIGAHLFGAGEIADVALLSVGVLALGGVALQGGEALYGAMCTTLRAQTTEQLDEAARHLAAAISLLGVQVVLAILMKQRPRGTFKTVYGKLPKLSVALKYQLPRNGRFAYNPKLTFVSDKVPGWGGTTSWSGDIRVSKLGTHEDRLLAIYHERVHSFLVPKFYFLRNLRCHIATAGYSRSYLLRYLEEALAETVSRVRVNGLGRENLIAGIQFPLRRSTTYYLTIASIKEEIHGIAFGSLSVGGMLYQLYQGAYFDDQ